MIYTILSFRSLIHSSASSILLLIPSSVCFSFQLLYSSVLIGSFFTIFISVEDLYLSAEFNEHLYDYYFESLYLVDNSPPFQLVIFLGFCLVLSCFLVWNVFFCFLILPVCFYVLGRTATSPGLEKVDLFRRCIVGQSSGIYPFHQSQVTRDIPWVD